LVKFLADYRIKPHAPPFIQTPANLFKFYPCDCTLQVRYFRVNLNNTNNIVYFIPINSQYRLLGSPILFDTYILAVRRLINLVCCRGIWKFISIRNFISITYILQTSIKHKYLDFIVRIRQPFDLYYKHQNHLAALYT